MPYPDSDVTHQMWTFTGGAIIVLLQSIVSEMKRRWWSLLIGCALGGMGSWVAGHVWHNSPYLLIICGVAAVMTENLLSGLVNASKAFADSPIKVTLAIARTFLPAFGKGSKSVSVKIEQD